MQNQKSFSLWVQWVLATTLGAFIGWLLSSFIGLITVGVGLLGAGLIVGFVLGWIQEWLLKHSLPGNVDISTGWGWQIATMAGGGLGFLIFVVALFAPPILLPGLYASFEALRAAELLAALSGGTVLGIAQWRVLRRCSLLSIWWIPASAVGWTLGWYIADSIIAPVLGTGSSPDGTLAVGFGVLLYAEFVIATITSAAITGIAFIPLFRVPKR